MKTETTDTNIVKVDSCPSLTGKSTLTYHIGCNADEIQIRVHANTGGGYFSKEWIAFSVIQETLAKQSKPFSSMLLKPLFGNCHPSVICMGCSFRSAGGMAGEDPCHRPKGGIWRLLKSCSGEVR